MIPGHCRHKTYPVPDGNFKMPTTCKAGVNYADVQLDIAAPKWDREPCNEKGRANGATCASFAPWTADEIAEEEKRLNAVADALVAGKCVECGATLLRRGTAFACPNGHVSGFACGKKDIRDGAPPKHSRWPTRSYR